MKLEVGKTYVLFNGEVKECTRFCTAKEDTDFFSHYGRFILGMVYYHEDGTFAKGCPNDLDVSHEYKEETTVEYKTFSEMTDEEKGALLLAEYKGKIVELSSHAVGGWKDRVHGGRYHLNKKYRVKAEPVITTASRYLDSVGGERYSVSYTLVDGVPDCSTVTMDKSVTT
jgi:hypothetical protein